jgi:glycosyltransferase involved in cell wall biosynthesis
MGATFLHHIDDNLFDVIVPRKRGYPPKNFVSLLSYILDQADGALTSTPVLRKRLLTHNSNIQVVPNALDERLFSVDARVDDLSTNKPDNITIGYMGTKTHDADLKIILPALNKIARRYQGKIRFEIVGVIGSRKNLWRLKRLPLQYLSPKVEDIAYIRFLPWFTANVRWDIALAPLVDNAFNRSKSDIKFLDYAAIGAAGIFSQGPVYSSTIKHLETGWLVDNRKKNWVEALDTLITDESLRREIAQNASRYLYNYRILAHCSYRWVDALSRLCELDLEKSV